MSNSTQTSESLKPLDASAARQRCMRYRKRILDVSQEVTALHIAPAFSCLEITDLIYHVLMRQNSDGSFIDTFLMSKGHGCLSQYVILEEFGILKTIDIEQYCTPEGILGAHPDYGNPGITASTGSLGHGMGIAAGIAYADKLNKENRIVYVVLSDGELQEGSTWEALMMAANLEISKLIVFLDLNDFGGLERMSDAFKAFYPVADKISAFGWDVAEVNGHNVEDLYSAVLNKNDNKPLMVIANTVKGKGVSFMEHIPIWHYRSPSKEEYTKAISELKEIEK